MQNNQDTLSSTIANSMQLRKQNIKAKLNTPGNTHPKLPSCPHYNVSPVPMNPRLRKYFGLNNPHSPY